MMANLPEPETSVSEPDTAAVRRQAGVCLHIASLPGPYGIGEIGAEARSFVDTLSAMQLGVWQFLPTGPTAYGDSPYQPLSTFAGNENLISIGDLLAMGLLTEDEAGELKTLPDHYVDYGQLIPIKKQLLNVAAQRFSAGTDFELRASYADFLAQNDKAWLHDYAIFRILKTRHGERPWPEWQPEYVHRDPAALAELEDREATEIESIKVTQFLFHHQWRMFRSYANGKGISLFGDMPIYIALDSSDAWANREILSVDEDGNIVRIDHFRGFEAYWAVAADSETARVGSWVPGPGDGLFEAIKASLGSLPIVAEDLGVITQEVEDLRDRYELPGMRVLQFDVTDEEFELAGVGENSVCYTGTHDNDTTIGWFHGSPDDIRTEEEIRRAQEAVLAMTGGSAETIHTDLIKAAFSTAARLAIAPMQDYLGLGSEARINTPGTCGGNWRWRLTDSQLTPELCDNIANMVRASGRGPAL